MRTTRTSTPIPRIPAPHERNDRPRDLAPDGRPDNPLRRRHRHRRDDHRRRPLPQVAELRTSRSSGPTPKARSTPAALGGPISSRASARTSGPTTYDPSVVDRVVMVSDTDSFLTARRVTVEEGILVGGSTGTAVWAALQLAPELDRDDVVVVLIPDSGRGYLSKLYNDEWMADHGFLRTSGHTVSDLLERKGARLMRHDPRPPDRDGPPGDRSHGRVRRLPDAGDTRPSRPSRRPRSLAPCTSATSCKER